MTTEQIKSLQQAIGTAAWKLNLDRLAERQIEESDFDALCDNCQATLTAADREAGECTQCRTSLSSDDEDLRDDDYGDY
jgi:hypothetical protein